MPYIASSAIIDSLLTPKATPNTLNAGSYSLYTGRSVYWPPGDVNQPPGRRVRVNSTHSGGFRINAPPDLRYVKNIDPYKRP
jgi:hypothetical protein